MKQKSRFLSVIAVIVTLVSFGCNDEEDKTNAVERTDSATISVNKQVEKTLDKNLLAGDWIRTDAEYKIQISELFEDGKMKAGYFNPRSINVSQAQWKSEGAMLKIYIELRDQNYPGSNYNLVYLPDRKVLAGEYYQAVERNKYKVEFAKSK